MTRLGGPYSPASNLRSVRDPEALGAISYMALTAFIAASASQVATGGGDPVPTTVAIVAPDDREAGR